MSGNEQVWHLPERLLLFILTYIPSAVVRVPRGGDSISLSVDISVCGRDALVGANEFRWCRHGRTRSVVNAKWDI